MTLSQPIEGRWRHIKIPSVIVCLRAIFYQVGIINASAEADPKTPGQSMVDIRIQARYIDNFSIRSGSQIVAKTQAAGC